MLEHVLLAGQLKWNIPLLIFIIGAMIIYVLSIKRLTNEKMHSQQLFLFLIGLCLFYMMIGSPFSTISHLSFSLHMIQMSFLYFIVPPLLLLGLPKNWFNPYRRIILGFFKPFVALVAFSALFLTYHLPPMLTIFSQNPSFHNAYILSLFLLSLLMWQPMASIDPMPRFNIEQKKRYAQWNGILIMPACLLFIVYALIDGMNNPFHTQLMAHLCLPSQSTYSVLPPPFNTPFDQISAGLLMLGLHKFSIKMTLHLGENIVHRSH